MHRRMCKQLAHFRLSRELGEPHIWMDSQLLSQLVSEHGERLIEGGMLDEDLTDALATFCSLIPSQNQVKRLPICAGSLTKALSPNLVEALHSRFCNNNFVIHSHLYSIGHGIFPLASRLFNHSCKPNAVTIYDFFEGTGVSMKVKALRDIPENDEVSTPRSSIPYLTIKHLISLDHGPLF